MGILEEVAGAAIAYEATKKVDPNASLLTEAAATVAGFEGTEKLTEIIKEKEAEKTEGQG